MPAYLIQSPKGQRGDILIDGDDLVLTFSGNWAIFADTTGPTLAIPADQAAGIQRVDEQPAEPAPEG